MYKYEEDLIKINVFAENEINKYKSFIYPKLKKVLREYEGQKILNKDLTIKAKITKDINDILNIDYHPETFYKGGFSKIHRYLDVSEYSLTIKVSFNFMTGINKNNNTESVYKDFYLYIGSFQGPFDVKQKIFKLDEFIEKEFINIDEELLKFEEAKKKKEEYEEALNKLYYANKTILR